MTEQEFREQLDALVSVGLNNLNVGVVYGQLCTIKQFVEVIYDSNIVNYLQNLQAKKAAEDAEKESAE